METGGSQGSAGLKVSFLRVKQVVVGREQKRGDENGKDDLSLEIV